MTWLSIVAILFEILGPLLRKWLEDLLTQAAANLDASDLPSPPCYTPEGGMDKLLAEADKLIPWWMMLRRLALYRVMASLKRHSSGVWATAVKGETVPQLTVEEFNAIARDV